MSTQKEFQTGEKVRTGFIKGNTFGYRPIQYSEIDGNAIFEGDIVLGTIEEMEQLTLEITGKKEVTLKGVVVTGEALRWPGGIIPFTIDPSLPNVARVNSAIDHWQNNTGIRFIQRSTEQNFITFRPSTGCSSSVGMKGGQQFINLADGCSTGSTIHEIGHAVGLWHEQSREDRDLHIRIFWENIESGKEHNFNQHISDGDDVGTYDFDSIMHYHETAFSKNGKPTIETINGEDVGQRNGLSDGDIAAVNYMYFPSIPVLIQNGVYTIQQKSNNRFVDAHEYAAKDFSVVTRTAQNNSTQRWLIKPIGGIFTIQQKSNNRYVDAHEIESKDFTVVTRTAQNNSTQRWILTSKGGPFTIQQQSNNRFLDAHDTSTNDFRAVTRSAQNNDTQKWILTNLGNNTFTIQQKSNGRFLDAHEIQEKDFALVTRTAQNNNTQRWKLTPIATLCTIQQQSNNRFLDAHDTSTNDFRAVTRASQLNDTQIWILTPLGNNTFTLQQKSNGQYLDAHEIQEKDFALVTRTVQNNDTQKWIIKKV
ncbi:MAG: hypothetical protein E6Q95_04930 [Chitinophagaceae bacterium]|nr:MAG: hypothetical protein E6Q95_04930 [Chitinophagaceae bacterium]